MGKLVLEEFYAETKRTSMVLSIWCEMKCILKPGKVLKEIPENERNNLIEAYRKIFYGDDEEKNYLLQKTV